MGKFGLQTLKNAEDLLTLFSQTISKLTQLRSDIQNSPASPSTLYKIDEISNICSIIADTSQAISELFPSEAWKTAGYSVQDQMIDIYSDLNHDKTIFTRLQALKSSENWQKLSETEKFFTDSVIRDLKKDGFGTPETASLIQRLQSQFIQNIRDSKSEVNAKFDEMESINIHYRPERLADKYSEDNLCLFNKQELTSILNYCKSPTLRPKIFEALSNLAKENYGVLDQLIKCRNSFSLSAGFQNFSHFALAHQSFPVMPDTLLNSLHRCSEALRPKLENEYSILLDQKALTEQVSRSNPVSLHPSDIPFYMQKHLDTSLTQTFPSYSSFHSIQKYFSISNILEGVKALLSVQFHLEAQIVPCPSSETWSNDIFKLNILHNNEPLGVIYLDLFERRGKSTSPAAKFNIVCGRKQTAAYEAQVPVVVLSTNFPKSSGLATNLHFSLADLGNQGVNFPMVQEFYHELGHALHSLCSQNEFQMYAGTRVPVDLAELPSHLFENFVTDYSFVKTWALHQDTKQPISEAYFSYISAQLHQFPAFRRHIQLSIALFDLYLHSSPDLSTAIRNFSSKLECKELKGNWFCSIEHFIEYGGCYYSYILDEALSSVVWETVYQKEAFNGKAGKLVYENLLSKGGSLDPQEQINRVFRPFLVQGEGLEKDVDPFYLMEFWFKGYFGSSALVSIDRLRAERQVFYKG